MNITILGGGSWGSALAVHLAKKNHSVKIWEFFQQQAQEMQEKRICPLLPQARFAKNIFITSDFKESLINTDLILIVVPSDKVAKTIDNAKPYLKKQPLILCSKGLSSDAGLLSEIIRKKVSNPIYCLYGPTHAEEVCLGKFTSIVLAGGKGKNKLQKELQSPNLKVELSDDLIGVQVASALKNVLAVFVGIADGLGMGDNAKAYLITAGLKEITSIGTAWGAKKETFIGLAGIGDIIVTCLSEHSRNRHVGEQLGKGRKLPDILAEMKMIAEGVTTTKQAYALAKKFKLKLPLITGLHQILFEEKDPKEIIQNL